MNSITIKDISRATDISVATVARAFRYPEQVSEKKRKAIYAAADELGYIPNMNACNLKSNVSRNIGFMINDVQNTFFNQIIRVVEDELSVYGYQLLIRFGTEDKSASEEKIKSMLSASVCALIFSPPAHSGYLERLLKLKDLYTLQLFTEQYGCFDSLIVNDFMGTYLAVKRLILAGHRKILLTGFENAIWNERVKGYRKAFEDSGLAVDERYLYEVSSGEFLYDQMTTRIFKSSPTAIIPVANQIGVSVIKALNQLKLKIPGDVSVICYDDTAWANLLNISAVTHPIGDLGRKIAAMLVEGIREKSASPPVKKEIVEPFILERESVAPPKANI